MVEIVSNVFLGLWVLYFGWVLLMLFSWIRVKKERNKPYEGLMSVLIPFRNEENNLAELVQSLIQVEDVDFEVLFINDHSEDGSVSVLEESLKSVDFPFEILNNEKTGGKKSAIKKGVEVCKGKVIVQTDADCKVPKLWLKGYRNYFGNEKTNLVFGAVKFEFRNFWTDVLQTEFSSLILVGASMLNLKKPNMCNGANLGYRKVTFLEVGGYDGNEHLASGDDEFLMHKVFLQDSKSVCFLNEGYTVVSTQAPSDVTTFINQRIRWSSKWKEYKLSHVKLLPIFLTLVYASLILSPWVSSKTVGEILFYKFILDLLLVKMASQFLGVKPNLLAFILSFVGYPFYLLYFAVASNRKKYTWKSRTIING